VSEPKFTPGPWSAGGVFSPGTENETRWIWSKAAPGMQSGNVVARGVRSCDARLIAAAPDLLAALKRVVYNDDRPLGRDYLIGNLDMEAAKAAIAKAEGLS
jgi:hypothetical protein